MKVIVVGAGIAGLSAGIYASQSGYDVTIYESHNIAGGNSTSWKREGYFFEGGMHWLVGSNEKTALHKLWREVGALQENNPIYQRDPFLTYMGQHGNLAIHRDLDKFKDSLLRIAPEDKEAILQLIKDIKAMANVSMPVTDIKGVKVKHKYSMSASQLFGYMKAGKPMKRLSNMSIRDYVAQFKSKDIHELLSYVVPMDTYSALSFLITIGGFVSKDSGYPKGGSLRMAQNMAKTFEKLGGNIIYNQKVSKVNVEQSKANGVWVDNVLHHADAVIMCADTRMAIDHLFEQALHEPWMDALRKDLQPVNCTFISFGIESDLSHLPENLILPLNEPFEYAGKLHASIGLNNYAKFDGYAPAGCSSVTMMLFEDTYDDWECAYKDGTYQDKKEELASMFINVLEKTLPETKGKIAVWDIATPLTYERYCSTYRGSWMSVLSPNMKQQAYPCTSQNIQHLYFAGQRLVIPGGLPTALVTGRTAVQHLCKDTNVVFQNYID